MLPQNFQLQYSDQQIHDAVRRLGADISNWASTVWRESHTDILTIPVLRGGLFFFADLVRKVEHSVEIAPARSWGYTVTDNNIQRPTITVDIEGVPAKGRAVLLVDDICDSGRTLAALQKALLEAGALEVKSAVLIRRKLPYETFLPEWYAFEYDGPEWFVGYGMEDCERWRNLSSVFVIRQS